MPSETATADLGGNETSTGETPPAPPPAGGGEERPALTHADEAGQAERKPREWWFNEYGDAICDKGTLWSTAKAAEQANDIGKCRVRLVHVREVLPPTASDIREPRERVDEASELAGMAANIESLRNQLEAVKSERDEARQRVAELEASNKSMAATLQLAAGKLGVQEAMIERFEVQPELIDEIRDRMLNDAIVDDDDLMAIHRTPEPEGRVALDASNQALDGTEAERRWYLTQGNSDSVRLYPQRIAFHDDDDVMPSTACLNEASIKSCSQSRGITEASALAWIAEHCPSGLAEAQRICGIESFYVGDCVFGPKASDQPTAPDPGPDHDLLGDEWQLSAGRARTNDT